MHLYMSNTSAAKISAFFLRAMGVLPDDVHSSELERFDKPCATVVVLPCDHQIFS